MSASIQAKNANERATIALRLMRQASDGRALSDCFEMGDGDQVIMELRRRAEKNPNTASLVDRYLAKRAR